MTSRVLLFCIFNNVADRTFEGGAEFVEHVTVVAHDLVFIVIVDYLKLNAGAL